MLLCSASAACRKSSKSEPDSCLGFLRLTIAIPPSIAASRIIILYDSMAVKRADMAERLRCGMPQLRSPSSGAASLQDFKEDHQNSRLRS